MWLTQSTLLVALAAAGWALGPDIVNIPADGKLSEGKYVIYDKDGAEEASVLVTKDMLRTGEENNLRTLSTWLNKYFDKEDKNRPQIHQHYGQNGGGGNYVYGQGYPAGGVHHSHPAVTVINGQPANTAVIGSNTGGTIIPPGAIVIRPASTTHRPPSYPDHHHHGDGDYHHNYPSGNYPNRPHYPNGYPDRYPERYPGGRPDRYPDRHPGHNYPDRDGDRYHGHHPDRDGDRYHGHHSDRDGDRDRYPYDRYPHGHYPYDEYNGYDGHGVWPYGPWAKLRSASAAVPRSFFPIYAHQLEKEAGKA